MTTLDKLFSMKFLNFTSLIILLSFGSSSFAEETLSIPSTTTRTFSSTGGNMRGYFFTAPMDFKITGASVEGASGDSYVGIVTYEGELNNSKNNFTDYTIKGTGQGSGSDRITFDVLINSGEIVGIYGNYTNDSTTYSINYGNAPHSSSIGDSSITLKRARANYNSLDEGQTHMLQNTDLTKELGLINIFYSLDTLASLNTEWVQPYAAMQSVGLGSIKNNRDLVLAKAGECNNSGWAIENTDYCIYSNANNTIASVNGNSSYGSYDYANFNTSINIEKTINDKWKAGIAYGVGSSNLDKYNFSSTTASLSSTNTHYSIYGVKKVSDKFTLKGMIGGSDFDYKGNRNYSTTSATSSYDTDGYTAEINGIWDIKKTIKNMKTPIRLKPSVGVAYAAHTQDGFSESGSGDLITLEANQAESLLFKTGISVDKQIPMEGGKWLLVPSIALNYEMDTYADDNHRGLKGGVTGSSDATTLVSAKTFGQHNGSVKVGADFVLTKDFMFNLNAEYGLAEGGDEQSYGGGFRWQF